MYPSARVCTCQHCKTQESTGAPLQPGIYRRARFLRLEWTGALLQQRRECADGAVAVGGSVGGSVAAGRVCAGEGLGRVRAEGRGAGPRRRRRGRARVPGAGGGAPSDSLSPPSDFRLLTTACHLVRLQTPCHLRETFLALLPLHCGLRLNFS